MRSSPTRGPRQLLVHGEYLAHGAEDTPVYRTDNMSLRLKIYAEGGENDLHAHPTEEHAFIVLEGSASFVDADGETMTVGPYEGVLLPAGTYYRFRNVGAGNLIMLRIGCNLAPAGTDRAWRVDRSGALMENNPHQLAAGRREPVPTGRTFGATEPSA